MVQGIINPAAGSGSTGESWPGAIVALREAWLRSAYVLTEAPGHATALARQAGLDGYEEEPPTADNPLFELSNVVVTPHRAGFSREGVYGCSMVVEDIVRILNGEEPRFPVN